MKNLLVRFMRLIALFFFPKKERAEVLQSIVPEESVHEIRLVKKKRPTIFCRKAQLPGKLINIRLSKTADLYQSKFRKQRRPKVKSVRIISLVEKDRGGLLYNVASA